MGAAQVSLSSRRDVSSSRVAKIKPGLAKMNSHQPCPGPPGCNEVLLPWPVVHNALMFTLPSLSRELGDHQLRNNTIRLSQFHLFLLILLNVLFRQCIWIPKDISSQIIMISQWLLFKHALDNILLTTTFFPKQLCRDDELIFSAIVET